MTPTNNPIEAPQANPFDKAMLKMLDALNFLLQHHKNSTEANTTTEEAQKHIDTLNEVKNVPSN